MTTTTCQARLGCLVGRVDAQRQRRPPSRARGTSRFCLGAGSVSRCLFHFATGPLRRNRTQLAIGRRTSSINARGGDTLQIYQTKKQTFIVRHAREQSLGENYKTICHCGPAGLEPAIPAPVRERIILQTNGAAVAQPIASAQTDTHTHRDKRKAC